MAKRIRATDTKGVIIQNLWFDPVSKVFYARKTKQGKADLDKSLGAVSLSLAKRLKDQVISDWLGDDKPGARKGAKLHKFSTEWEDRYFPSKIKTVKKATLTAYDVAYRTHLKPHFGEMYVEHIDEAAWEKLLDETPKEVILFNTHKGLNNFLKFCKEVTKIIPAQPKLKLPKERKQKLKGNVKAVGQVYERHQVVMAARRAGRGSELRLAILMGYRMGMRIGEVCSLRYVEGSKAGEFNWVESRSDGMVFHLNETKTKKARHVYADPMIARIVSGRRGQSPWVYPQRLSPQRKLSTNSLDNYWQDIKRGLAITGRFHDLRHTFLTWKFRDQGAKANIALICNYAGLSLDEAEKTYLHLNEYDTRAVIGARRV